MKEFTLLITILFNFPNGEHQEIQIERKLKSEIDCHTELEKQNDISEKFSKSLDNTFLDALPLLLNCSLIL